MRIEIKPCPFCGGEATLAKVTNGFINDPVTITNAYRVGCKQCNIYTKSYESKIWQDKYGVVQIEANGAVDAIDVWNRRYGEKHEHGIS